MPVNRNALYEDQGIDTGGRRTVQADMGLQGKTCGQEPRQNLAEETYSEKKAFFQLSSSSSMPFSACKSSGVTELSSSSRSISLTESNSTDPRELVS